MNTSPQAHRYEPRVLVRRVERRKPTPLTLLVHGLASVVLVPSYALAAAAIGTPGMRFHLEALGVALRLVTHGGTGLVAQAGRLALYPMDSTRYFEFDWIWSQLQRLRACSEVPGRVVSPIPSAVVCAACRSRTRLVPESGYRRSRDD